MSDDEFLSVQSCAKTLRVDERTIRRWIAAGEIPAVRAGRRLLRIPRTGWLAYIASRATATDAATPSR